MSADRISYCIATSSSVKNVFIQSIDIVKLQQLVNHLRNALEVSTVYNKTERPNDATLHLKGIEQRYF